jgi:hypothetical protein
MLIVQLLFHIKKMPPPASGVGFIGLSVAAFAALMTFSLHKIEEGK